MKQNSNCEESRNLERQIYDNVKQHERHGGVILPNIH